MKHLLITDELHDQFKHLTCNQIQLVLIRLLNDDQYDPKVILYHRKLKRFIEDNNKLGYLKPHIDFINSIKNIRLDKSNKKEYQDQLQKLKKQLPIYYKIPVSYIDFLISPDMTKSKLLIALQLFKIKRINFHTSRTFNTSALIKEIFGVKSRNDLSLKTRLFKDEICDILVTISDILVTISDKKVTISDILVTQRSVIN